MKFALKINGAQINLKCSNALKVHNVLFPRNKRHKSQKLLSKINSFRFSFVKRNNSKKTKSNLFCKQINNKIKEFVFIRLLLRFFSDVKQIAQNYIKRFRNVTQLY